MSILQIRIVTDSSASIPPAMQRELAITVVPIPIQFGSETFMDGVDPAPQFYERLASANSAPTTSTPSPGSFLETYRRLAVPGTAIISLHIMESKSAVVNVARMAAAMLPEATIHVVDSQTTTLGLGLLAATAARAAKAGQTVSEVLQRLQWLIPRTHTHAAIRDLTQLRRSGRVSLGQSLVAGMLAVKPVLYLGRSLVEVADRVRGWPSAVERTVGLAREKAGEARVSLAVVHTNAEAEATALLARIRDRFALVDSMVADAGTALATHAGAGALGIVTMEV